MTFRYDVSITYLYDDYLKLTIKIYKPSNSYKFEVIMSFRYDVCYDFTVTHQLKLKDYIYSATCEV